MLNPVPLSSLVTGLVAGLLLAISPIQTASAAATAGVQPCVSTYSSGQVDRAIWRYRTHGIFSDGITIPDMAAPIADMDVTVNIDHDQIVNLEVSVAKNGVGEVFLAKHKGTVTGQDYVDTTFDDEASLDLTEGEAPFSGRFRPDHPLSFVDDANAGGEWRLRIWDHGYDDEIHPYGTLGSWSMTVTYAWCDSDGDGLRDSVDRCAQIAANTASGCPAVSRSLTLRHNGSTFLGRLVSSGVDRCHAGRAVGVWRYYNGVRRKIGLVTTGPRGGYRLDKPRWKGRYYAIAPRAVLRGSAECTRVRANLS